MSVRGGLRRFSRLFLDALRFGPQQRRKAPSPGRKMRMEALEPRLLLSADASILVLQAAGADVLRAPDAGTASLDSAERALSPSASAIFFVDSAVKEYASLVDACGAGAEVIILDSAADGIAQVANVLAGRTDVSALHVVSHGVAGRITLGASTLDAATLHVYADALRTWGDALTGDGDLLFYGCSIAQGEAGAALADQLAFLTGADVAASTDVTGNAAVGGDWNLEYWTGPIESGHSLSADAYRFTLAPTVDGIVAIAGSGSPRDELLASANVGQPVMLTGDGFTLSSQVVFQPSIIWGQPAARRSRRSRSRQTAAA